MRTRLIFLVAGLLLGSAITLGTQHVIRNQSDLVAREFGGSTQQSAVAGKAYTFDSGTLCLSGKGFATLSKVTAIDPTGGAKVTDFDIVSFDGSMKPDGFNVVSVCPETGDEGLRLAIDVRAASLPASVPSLRIDYVIDDRAKSTIMKNWAVLCKNDTDSDAWRSDDLLQQCGD